MNAIWANRLIAGTKTWDEVPDNRKAGVRAVLLERIEKGIITAEKYAEITEDDYQEIINE